MPSLVEPTWSLWSLLLLGMVNGLTFCSWSCLPLLTPYLVSANQGFRQGVGLTYCFLTGKVAAYTLLGSLAAAVGQVLHLHTLGQGGLGLILFLSGVILLWRLRQRISCQAGCKTAQRFPASLPVQLPHKLTLLLVGFCSGLVPCPPLTALLAIAASQGDVAWGGGVGFSYGLGLSLSPLLLFGGGLSLFFATLRQQLKSMPPYLEGVAACILLLTGGRFVYLQFFV